LATDFHTVALDRLLHRSTVLNIRGDSYRLKEKRLAKPSAIEVRQPD
jgi:DNA replication protein DnaC